MCKIAFNLLLFNNANKSFNKNDFVYPIGCALVGFLKFLKRGKKERLGELDLPPAPPPLEGFEEDMPALPELGEKESKEGFPSFDFPEIDEKISAPDEESTQFSSFPEIKDEPFQPIEPISPLSQEPAPQTDTEQEDTEQHEIIVEEELPAESLDMSPQTETGIFGQEKETLIKTPSGRTLYIGVNKFKSMIGSINNIRKDIKQSEEALAKLEHIKNSKDKSFDQMKSSLDDLQKKLIFVDKTLFKGE